MKNMKNSTKILMVCLGVAWMVVAGLLLFTGDYASAGAIMATPLTVPVIKSTLESPEDLAKELDAIFKSFAGQISDKIDKGIGEKDVLTKEELAEKLKGYGISEDTLKTITESINEHARFIEASKNKHTDGTTLKSIMKQAFSEEGLADKLKALYNSGSGTVDITKAVGTITTGNVTTDTGGNAILDYLNADSTEGIRLQTPFIEEFANVTRTSKPVYTYVDYIPGEGDIEFIAEGGTKPQLDLDVTVATATPVKAAGYEILTEESVTDIPRMESESRGLLFKKYLLKRQDGILFGDGVSPNPTGVTGIASAFNPATWTAAGIATPNLHDVIIACANQIYTTVSYTDDVEYYPNVAFVNPADFAALRVARDDNGQYLFPSFTLYNGQTIDGIRVIAKNKIPSGKILMGDFSKLNIVNYVDYSVRIGWINDQFIKNLFTMLGEGRFFTFVKSLDQRAFVYDDIATIVAAIDAV